MNSTLIPLKSSFGRLLFSVQTSFLVPNATGTVVSDILREEDTIAFLYRGPNESHTHFMHRCSGSSTCSFAVALSMCSSHILVLIKYVLRHHLQHGSYVQTTFSCRLQSSTACKTRSGTGRHQCPARHSQCRSDTPFSDPDYSIIINGQLDTCRSFFLVTLGL